MRTIKKLMVANRSEIAIRAFRAAHELGIATVAVYAEEDRQSLHRLKADESFKVGRPGEPLRAYLSIEEMLRVALESGADAIHPGYGFLSENPEFAEACEAHGLTFIGPSAQTMRLLGNKIAARRLAVSANVPVVPASGALTGDVEEILRGAEAIGYPLIIKASWGGGGRGMRVVNDAAELAGAVASARREAASAFGDDEVYLEKFVRSARHVEVQILGDMHGKLVHLFERDCSIQRRHQKVVERAPAIFLTEEARQALCEAALRIGKAAKYHGAGTVEFLVDRESGEFFFMEVNPRIQVEHTITEEITGIDLVKAQIRIAEGARIGGAGAFVPDQDGIRFSGHAIQCRITTENPGQDFMPDYGAITSFRGPSGLGVRTEGCAAFSGSKITPYYDALLEKVIAKAQTPHDATQIMLRALNEYQISGVATNLDFLINVVSHPAFAACDYDTRFIDSTPNLSQPRKRQDGASKLLDYIARTTVLGHPDLKDRARGTTLSNPEPPPPRPVRGVSTASILRDLGPARFAEWAKAQARVLVTDTSMRDAHQSLLATRVRTEDIVGAAGAYDALAPELFSIECWGGATFDAAMRFLKEDPWERLERIRDLTPNLNRQMLIRGANAVGYKNYARNAVDFFVRRAAASGIDIFRVFDCFNVTESMRRTIDAVLSENKLVEGAICYSGDILDKSRPKYDLSYYLRRAEELQRAGCHILCIKDMAGLVRPEAARMLVGALKRHFDMPVHFHTHDTSGISAASVLAAVEAGVDIIDLAMDAMSGSTSQPCLGSIVRALEGAERDTGLDRDAVHWLSTYWERTRAKYAAFESKLRSGASDVFQHEMPGGQITNLREQAKSLGLENRWEEIAAAYADANLLFGDIVKVTPSSKVVGDMAIALVSQNVSSEDVLSPSVEFAFPASVVDMLAGGLGTPEGGWPEALLHKAIGAKSSPRVDEIADLDLKDSKQRLEARIGRPVSENEFASWLMYPDVFEEYARFVSEFGPVTRLPTETFFYGMAPGEEIAVEIKRGRTAYIRLNAVSEVASGVRKVSFELNGEPRTVDVSIDLGPGSSTTRRKAEALNPAHIASPIPGAISGLYVKPGDKVERGSALASVEAMKMETLVRSGAEGIVETIHVSVGDQVSAKDLLLVLSV